MLTRYFSGDQIENEMDGTYSAYGVEERYMQNFGGIPEGESPLGKPRRR